MFTTAEPWQGCIHRVLKVGASATHTTGAWLRVKAGACIFCPPVVWSGLNTGDFQCRRWSYFDSIWWEQGLSAQNSIQTAEMGLAMLGLPS